MIRRLLRTLTTDVDGLRARIAYLEGENGRLADLRDHYKAEADALHALHDRAVDERDRLRALAGNTAATPTEARMLDIVRANPGMLAPDLGMLAHRNNCDRERAKAVAEHGEAYAESGWWNHPFSRGDYMPTEASRPLQTLHRKGLVRREKAGQTYRYWPTERA